MGHSIEVTQKDGTIDTGGIKTSVSQYTIEASIAGVNRLGHTTEVADVVIGCTSIDVVQGHSGRDSTSGSHPDGMGSEDVFFVTKSMFENQIALFAL